MTERLQKIISSAGIMSRRAAEDFIAAGRVTLNGVPARLGDRADAEIDRILVDGKALPSTGEKIYIMLNKPRGYVTTMKDEQGRKNVTALLKGLSARVYPVGRLDMYSEGLLIMTNDGDFANILMHPSHNFKKTYHTWVKGADIQKSLALLRSPMEIDGYWIKPAEAELLELLPDGARLAISISEGRNRQVRRMCAKAGLRVTRLLRVSEGPLELGGLKTGLWRKLSPEEVEMIKPKAENGKDERHGN